MVLYLNQHELVSAHLKNNSHELAAGVFLVTIRMVTDLRDAFQWPILLTRINFKPSMDK